jgi:hypothetical protein
LNFKNRPARELLTARAWRIAHQSVKSFKYQSAAFNSSCLTKSRRRPASVFVVPRRSKLCVLCEQFSSHALNWHPIAICDSKEMFGIDVSLNLDGRAALE